jgi:hypothetical protein
MVGRSVPSSAGWGAILCRLVAVAAVGCFGVGASGVAGASVSTAASSLSPAQATALGAKAYVYGLPLLDFERTARIQTSVQCPDAVGDAPLNTFSTGRAFAGPADRTVVAPNVDTLYSIAHLNLANGPVILSHPNMGHRYFVFELLDPYTNVISYVGSRTTGSGAGRFAITWTGGRNQNARGATVIRSRYRSVWVIGRTLATTRVDQRRAVALMRQYRLSPLGGPRTFRSTCKSTTPATVSLPDGLAFLTALDAALKRYPPPARDHAVLAQLKRIGVGPGVKPKDAGLPAATLAAAVAGVNQETVSLPTSAKGQILAQAIKHGGWYTPPADTGHYGTDYRTRAALAAEGLGANTPAEALYPIALTDASGHLLDGSDGSYQLTFRRGHLPPARAFWSLTMYTESGYLVANSAHRYSIGPSHPPLRRQADGNVVIDISHTRPSEADINWLPAPAAPFRLNLRLYWPRSTALDGTWQPPPITDLSTS